MWVLEGGYHINEYIYIYRDTIHIHIFLYISYIGTEVYRTYLGLLGAPSHTAHARRLRARTAVAEHGPKHGAGFGGPPAVLNYLGGSQDSSTKGSFY